MPGQNSGSQLAGGRRQAPPRRRGGRTGVQRRLDGVGDELRDLRVDGDVPAEQHPADDPAQRARRRTPGSDPWWTTERARYMPDRTVSQDTLQVTTVPGR